MGFGFIALCARGFVTGRAPPGYTVANLASLRLNSGNVSRSLTSTDCDREQPLGKHPWRF